MESVTFIFSETMQYTSRDGCNAFPQKTDSVINVKVEFGEGEGKVPLDNIAKRAEAYKPKERVSNQKIKEYIPRISQR